MPSLNSSEAGYPKQPVVVGHSVADVIGGFDAESSAQRQGRFPFTRADVVRDDSDHLGGTIGVVMGGMAQHCFPVEPASSFLTHHSSSVSLE